MTKQYLILAAVLITVVLLGYLADRADEHRADSGEGFYECILVTRRNMGRPMCLKGEPVKKTAKQETKQKEEFYRAQ